MRNSPSTALSGDARVRGVLQGGQESAKSSRPVRLVLETPNRSPTTRPKWLRCCATTAKARPPSASGARARTPRQHPILLRMRRESHHRRGQPQRPVLRDDRLQRRPATGLGHAGEDGRLARSHDLSYRGAGWAVVFDTPSRRAKQVDSGHGGTKVGMAGRPSARGHHGQGRAAHPVPAADRRRPHRRRGGRTAEAEGGDPGRTIPDGLREHGLQLRRHQGKSRVMDRTG